MSWKILPFVPWPEIGSAVSKGALGIKLTDETKKTEFDCARKGARLVAVGPA